MASKRPVASRPAPVIDLRALLQDPGAMANSTADLPGYTSSVFAPGILDLRIETATMTGSVRTCTIAPELAIMVASYSEAPATAMRGSGDGLLMLNLRLEGEAITENDDPTVDGRATLTYFTKGSSLRWRLPHGGKWRTLTIFGTPAAFDEQWGLGQALLAAIDAVPGTRLPARRLRRRPWTVTRESLDILQALLNCRFEGALARAYFEARGQQLVCEFLAAGPLRAGGHPVPARTREQVRRARAVLVADPALPHTLQSLARQVGLNRTLLAQGFRTEFGETVFDCLQRERMTRAWALLQASSAKVAAIAGQVGYQDSASFARAFKAHFGVTPTQAGR